MVNEKNYWNSIAKKAKKHHLEKNIARYKRQENISVIKKWCTNLKSKRILKTDLFEEMLITDSFFDWLQTKSKNVFGMDISNEIVNKSKKNFPKGNFFVEDIKKTSFKDDSFDLVISNSTLDHMSRGDLLHSLNEINRILKPKGQLILTIDNKENKRYYFFYQINKYFCISPFRQERCYSKKETIDVLKKTGFEIEETTGIIHIPTPFNKFAITLKKIFGSKANKYIQKRIKKFDSDSNGLKTAWQIAVKARKWD